MWSRKIVDLQVHGCFCLYHFPSKNYKSPLTLDSNFPFPENKTQVRQIFFQSVVLVLVLKEN